MAYLRAFVIKRFARYELSSNFYYLVKSLSYNDKQLLDSNAVIMNKSSLLILLATFLLFTSNLIAKEALPKVSSGKIVRVSEFASEFVPKRNIDIWLPANYSEKHQYDTVYMHDGQMLFDANTTWNKQEWQVDEVAEKLISSGKVKPFIVVGIWNSGETRYPEYFPQKVFENLSNKDKETVRQKLKTFNKLDINLSNYYFSDAYAKFIVHEPIPYIEKTYPVVASAKNRYLLGSSMGGLISWYTMMEYPEEFAGAACLSTHWPGMYTADNPYPTAFKNYIKRNLSKLSSHKLYFDTGDQTLDALYPPLQKNIDLVMQDYPRELWRSEFFPGAKHDEVSWAKRLHIPLEFMLAKP